MASANDRPERDDDRPAGARRLPYEKPTIVWEQPLTEKVSLMTACAKTPTTPGEDCSSGGLFGS